MNELEALAGVATDQKEDLIWEEINDGERLLEINSEYYYYEVVLNYAETGPFNWHRFPVILHRYKPTDQTKPLDTRHCENEQIAMATAAAWERITLRMHRKAEDEICQLTSP
jgi:uncharacterized membrane protein YgaE (UPF0421/DUF939 family)